MNIPFKRGLASGGGFCNRTEESRQILFNIENATHTLLISPRRYGKTSLALHAINQSQRQYIFIDLFLMQNNEQVMAEFYLEVGKLISHLIKPTEKALRTIESVLKNVKVSLTLGQVGFDFSLQPISNNNERLKHLLMGLDELLVKSNKKIIIFIDEFQSIVNLECCDEIESALRSVAQQTENITFIFSGSSRHLLGKVFDDRSRPLYKLCHQIRVERINEEHYIPFINKFAQRVWNKKLSDEVIDAIMSNTQRHSYYVNVLCERLFQSVKIPTVSAVINAWQTICDEEQSSIARDLAFLTQKQQQLLSAIAKNPGLTEPTAKHFLSQISLTAGGVTTALNVLLSHDIVDRRPSKEIFIIDPVLLYWLAKQR